MIAVTDCPQDQRGPWRDPETKFEIGIVENHSVVFGQSRVGQACH